MKLSASGVEPTFSQEKVTYLTTILLYFFTFQYICYNKCIDTKLFAILKQITNKQIYSDIYSMIK
ncbi:hypothetical protein PFAG_06076 [Plasmodium falciparum Santa Lucia]|uniref:Uncharacterized protein n=1 Tax=Plasmodium falciparum Santa Lucia TaxID=478859 RepID=W7FKQ1_PLAFA|nr:hypothetical protein PFAG_06076 [Plasmodium falciparum Santa Lucia]